MEDNTADPNPNQSNSKLSPKGLSDAVAVELTRRGIWAEARVGREGPYIRVFNAVDAFTPLHAGIMNNYALDDEGGVQSPSAQAVAIQAEEARKAEAWLQRRLKALAEPI